MNSRVMKVALAVAASLVMCGTALAQAPWSWDRDQDRVGRWSYQERHDEQYDKGLRDGRSDREHRRAWHPRHGNQAYMNGYRAGYGPGWRGDHDRDDGWRNGPNGVYRGRDVQQIAYNNGYQEGIRIGHNDRNAGRRYRPTNSREYKHGDSGYNSAYGNKGMYRNSFQDGFRAGYDRGFNGGFRR
jgi:hypothetical protein